MKKRVIIIFSLLAILLIIQFIKIDTKPSKTDVNNDYLVLTKASKEVNNIIKNSCYDCHSYETNYPWYSKTAPISWMVNTHIKEGRKHINFSEWGNYSIERQTHLQGECIEVLENNEMPLKSYTMVHTDAKLSGDSKKTLLQWFDLQIHSNTTGTEQ